MTGGVLGRAVEPEAGESCRLAGACLNCGAALVGPYCHSCGQAAHIHRTVRGFLHELAHGVFHFEGKVWRTLPMLAWRPGDLTRRYVAGERARFVSPLAIFLFSVFLMFAVFHSVGGPLTTHLSVNPSMRAQLTIEKGQAQGRLAQLQRQRAALAAKGASTEAIDEQIREAQAEAGALGAIANGAAVSPEAMKVEGVPGGAGWFNEAYKRAKQNPDLLAYKLESNAYKFSWALIPISVPFLWLLFAFRRQYKAYDHMVFVTYSIAFMTLLLVGLSLVRAAGIAQQPIVIVLGLLPPIHMYRQLKGAYGLSRLGAAWRALLLAFFALIAITLFLLLLIAIGVG